MEKLRHKYPWPDSMPQVELDPHGWFGWCHCEVLEQLLSPDTKIILELGAWLGKSTRWFCKRYPQATVVTVDHWLGSPEITADDQDAGKKAEHLYETFVANCWKYRDRIIPIRKRTWEAIVELATTKLKPDMIYVDASHNYEDVKMDLLMCCGNFPDAQICGDDYGGKWVGVKKAVDEMSEVLNKKVYFVEHAWALVPKDFVIPDRRRTHNDDPEDEIGT